MKQIFPCEAFLANFLNYKFELDFHILEKTLFTIKIKKKKKKDIQLL